MNKSIPKIGLILIAVIVFPTLFFSVYEVNNLSKNERIVDSIYSSQLASIVFSLNQYSDDVINWWAGSIDNPELNDVSIRNAELNGFVKHNNAVQAIFLSQNTSLSILFVDEDAKEKISKELIVNKLQNEAEMVQKLQHYLESGYRKIHPIKVQSDSLHVVLFALHEQIGSANICGLVINPSLFVRNNLGPKIQNMAQERFNVSIFDKLTSREIYSNNLPDALDHKMRIKEDLWLFENYEVGIQLMGDPIEHMVKKRTQNNIIMIVLMDVVLLLGAWFVYRNVQREIKLAQIKSEFVSNVSHEIKTPLALINMYSETLDMGRVKSEEKKIEYYKVINREAKRLARMVNKILNFSKIESGKREYNFINTDVNELVEQIASTYQHHFTNSGFKYDIKTEPNLPLIHADEEAVVDAIGNLIDNAIKYSGTDKYVELTTGFSNEMVFVKVHDSGIGITAEEQKLIFDKFYRVTQGNLANKAKGSGIGLNIVKHIVDAHGGEINLESKVGKGSSFTLYFPTINR